MIMMYNDKDNGNGKINGNSNDDARSNNNILIGRKKKVY